MDNSNLIRPILLARILYEYTDYDHSLTTSQLMSILEKEYGIKTHRTTIGTDIEMLQSLGMDIQLTKSTQNHYNVLGRYFSDAELKMMIDAVASSRFISKKDSAEIIRKISALAGKNASQRMVRNVSVERRIKGTNRNVLNIVDAINEAINAGKQITFQYFEYTPRKVRKLRNNGNWYVFSPYRLVWNGDYYYTVGYSEKHETITSFRVDRISAVPKILEDDAVPTPEGFDLDRHLNTMYHMFSTERRTVELICDNQVMDSIIDRFGVGVKTQICDKDHFCAEVEIAVNNVFYSWIFGFQGKVEIKAPEDVKNGYNDMVKETFNAMR